jgi:hypothetical protein
MKTVLNRAFWALTLMGIFAACKPDIPEIGDRPAVVDGFPGSWQLTSATLTDLLTPVPETRDASRFYKNSTDFWLITFKDDRSYTVDQKGPGFNFFGDAGTWELLDREDFPTKIRLNAADGTSQTFNLLNMPRATDQQLGLRVTREACGQPYVNYSLRFTRQ